ncbi:hypothetical protein ACFFF7_02065 [Novosphingobium aquiterrae]|uniref:DUF1269 domain-containing protein n=1 Tax=Novosphingobium aquiterrae TaxID=624388 RepID=A0ABV6PEE2_9SPHN
MGHVAQTEAAYVIKAEEISALNYLDPDHPRPLLTEWINRGTDQKMRRTSIDLLLRTMTEDSPSPSVARLHQSSGLRVIFATAKDRDAFANAFAGARTQLALRRDFIIATIFDSLDSAQHAVGELTAAGIPEESISLLHRAGDFSVNGDESWKGHSKMSVAAAVAGGGIAGALLGIGMMVIVPGLGAVAAAGAIASSLTSVASLSGIFGATGGAMAKMLTDHDVDGREANYYERQIRRGRVFVSVDTRLAPGQEELARRILKDRGGQTAKAA